MNIVTGYIPTPEGLAAVDHVIEQARTSGAVLTVVDTGRNGDHSDPVFATGQDLDALDAQLRDAGIEHAIVQPVDGSPAAASIIATAEQVRRRPRRDRHPTPLTGRQAHHRQRRPGRAAGADCPVVAVEPRR